MKLKSLPQKLYKYRAFNVPSLRLLSEAEIYYSDPKQFNDPMDCDPSIEVDVDQNPLEKLCYKLLRRTQTEDKAKDVIDTIRYESTQYDDYLEDRSAEDRLKRLLAEEIKQLLHRELGTKGVFSLSGVWNSPLMWSHYADQHRGFCIEYDTTEEDHPSIGAVNYGSPRSVKASDLFEWKFRKSKEAEQRVQNTYFFSKAASGDMKRSGEISAPLAALPLQLFQ